MNFEKEKKTRKQFSIMETFHAIAFFLLLSYKSYNSREHGDSAATKQLLLSRRILEHSLASFERQISIISPK